MTVFSGGDAIREFLGVFDEWLSQPVDVFLLGGSAMTAQGLKDQTEDIDLAFAVTSEFEHVHHALQQHGFEVLDEPTESFDSVGTTIELRHPDREFRVDLFERQVVGKVWITDRMRDRADEFRTGEHATAYVLADEDMFLLKAVSAAIERLIQKQVLEPDTSNDSDFSVCNLVTVVEYCITYLRRHTEALDLAGEIEQWRDDLIQYGVKQLTDDSSNPNDYHHPEQ